MAEARSACGSAQRQLRGLFLCVCPLRAAGIAAVLLAVGGCATLPDAGASMATGHDRQVAFEGARGQVTDAKSAKAMAETITTCWPTVIRLMEARATPRST